jgi:hypothetical protein
LAASSAFLADLSDFEAAAGVSTPSPDPEPPAGVAGGAAFFWGLLPYDTFEAEAPFAEGVAVREEVLVGIVLALLTSAALSLENGATGELGFARTRCLQERLTALLTRKGRGFWACHLGVSHRIEV